MAHKIIVTEEGLTRTANASANGFLIELSSFAVTPADTFVPALDDKALVGTPFYRGAITSIEAVSGSTVKCVLYIPNGYPMDAESSPLAEVAIYTSDGAMFAHGRIDPTVIKERNIGFTISVFVSCRRLGDVINVLVGQTVSIPSASRVASLPNPRHHKQNAVSVLDEYTNKDESTAAGVALRYGAGGSMWAFAGHTRTYFGTVEPKNDTSFLLDVNRQGFWMNQDEEAIIQVVAGKEAGQSRRVRHSQNVFSILDKPLALDGSSIIAFWRTTAQQLPDRAADIPRYAVLGIGVNDWIKSEKRLPVGSYRQVNKSGVLTAGQRSVKVDGLSAITQVSKELFFVYLNGVFEAQDKWSLAANGTVTVKARAEDVTYNVEVLDFLESKSAATQVYESFNIAEEDQVFYQLPIIPQAPQDVWVFVNGIKINRAYHRLEGSMCAIEGLKIKAGDTVVILCFANYEQANTRSKAVLSTMIYAENFAGIPVPAGLPGRHSTIIHIDGRLIPQEYYWIDAEANMIQLYKDKITASVGDQISVIALTYEDGYIVPGTIETTGTDTGPKWTDPAGVDAWPCRVKIERHVFESNGTDTLFPVRRLRDKNYAVVFIGDMLYDPDQYEYSATTSTIIMKSAVPSGRKIDIYAIETIDDPHEIGDELLFLESQFQVGQDDGLYALAPGADINNTFVYVDGKFEHAANLSFVGSSFRFVRSPKVGLPIYTVTYIARERPGYATRVLREKLVQDAKTQSYQFVQDYSKRGLMLFSGLVNQLPDAFTVEDKNPQYVTIKKPVSGLPLHTLYLRNGIPKTRLIKRDEFEEYKKWLLLELDKYIPKIGQHVGWENLTTKLRNMLACPLMKIMAAINGNASDLIGGSDKDAGDLADSLGVQPVKKDVKLDLLTTAAYAAMGAGAMLGQPTRFNVFKYLEIILKDQLGSDSFSIKEWEKNKKYLIDKISVDKLEFEAIQRNELPAVHGSTSVYVRMDGVPASTTIPSMSLMVQIHDMVYSYQNVTLPAGWTYNSTQVRMKSVVREDPPTGERFYKMVVTDDVTGRDYRMTWQRPQYVDPKTYNDDFMILLDNPDNAPMYVRMFGRIYSNYQYNDLDINRAMWCIKNTNYDTQRLDRSWSPGGVLRATVMAPGYLANVGYTASIAFSASVTNFDADTGDADLNVNLTSGTVGYTYFPANQFMKKMELPVQYTIFPGMIVNEDGSIDLILDVDNLFKSCCWTDFNPALKLNCTTGLPEDGSGTVEPDPSGTEPYVDLSYIDPTYFESNLAASKGD